MSTVKDEIANEMINPPAKITEILRSLWSVGIISAAVNLNIFDSMADGPESSRNIASKIACDSKSCQIFLNTLVGLDLVEKDGDQFSLTEEAMAYLVSDQPLYIGDYVKVYMEINKRWFNLAEAVKSGEPISRVNEEREAQEFFPKLAASLFGMNYAYAHFVAEHISKDLTSDSLQVLDLAAGSAVWSIPLAKRYPEAKIEALDFEAVLEVTKSFVEKNQLKDQYRYLSGGWRDVKLSEGKYDLVYLGHILHSEGKEESIELLAYVHRSLKPEGKVAVAEFLVDDTRCKPAAASMFAMNMLMLTTQGCVFTENEVKGMLADAGFSGIEVIEEPGYESKVLVARKS